MVSRQLHIYMYLYDIFEISKISDNLLQSPFYFFRQQSSNPPLPPSADHSILHNIYPWFYKKENRGKNPLSFCFIKELLKLKD